MGETGFPRVLILKGELTAVKCCKRGQKEAFECGGQWKSSVRGYGKQFFRVLVNRKGTMKGEAEEVSLHSEGTCNLEAIGKL